MVKEGFQVHYLLIGNNNEQGITKEGIHYRIFKLKTFSTNRFVNFIMKRLNPHNNYKLLFKEAQILKADIYHFHDLWINRIGLKLKYLKHKPVVFYDVHEPHADDYVSYIKAWRGFGFLIRLFAFFVDRWEKNSAKNYDLITMPVDSIQNKFAKKVGKHKTVVLYNYTDLIHDFKPVAFKDKKYDLIYSGGISELRGVYVILGALIKATKAIPNIRLALLGNYYPSNLKNELQEYIEKNDITKNVYLLDAVPYKQVVDYYNQSKIGLVLLQSVPTYELSLPIKIFEYMAFGLPVLGSNFGYIKKYIEKDACGIAIAPNDTGAISTAIIQLLTNKDLYSKYSENGRVAAQSKYRWELEFEKLLGHYKTKLDARR